ncbi:glycosyltransferase family 4 protein [Acidiluteibacter ferrifornacis]|uniref:Glycosyltransferase n=1 Tax=Acidiluteibacter ferrifornacis TaxID=2692424 RepID=A0A6N9NLL4_9FLAO|nr:glycosyltransferase family 4 protein [Acidiluteibacter ferrifornacis]NBG66130.1 glycosyltransferase [Acidiluteibacter ferrifornacis]
MKIAIICGHFVPSLGYVEVHLANALHRLGHSVKVITSNKTSSSARYSDIKNSESSINVEVVRLKPWFSFGQIVVANGIKEEINKFKPNKVIVIGLGKIFPRGVFQIQKKDFEIITLLGDNEDTYSESSKSIKRRLLHLILKKPLYELAILKSDKLLGYTPSTKEVVNQFLNERFKTILQEKYGTTTLGFDAMEFNYSPDDRKIVRKELGVDEDSLVLITATRITPSKKIEKIIDALEILSKKGWRFKYVLIGFSNFDYCEKLKSYISEKGLDEVVITLPFMPRDKMNSYYNMADIGLWTQAAISIFEGLATGLYLLLPSKRNVSHILSEETGEYYSEHDLIEKLEKSVRDYSLANREELTKKVSAKFSFETIAKKIIEN